MKRAIGIDLGGTNIKAALIDCERTDDPEAKPFVNDAIQIDGARMLRRFRD